MDRFLEKDWVLKAISLLTAFGLWFTVMSNANPVATHTYSSVPISVVGLPKGDQVNLYPSAVDVQVQATNNKLVNLSRSDLHPFIDVSHLNAGGVAVVQIKMPNAVALLGINPTSVNVHIQKPTKSTRSVRAEVIGNPSVGYFLGSPSLPSKKVTVIGVPSVLKKVTGVVARISVQKATKSFTQKVTLIPVDAQGLKVSGVTVSPATLSITTPVFPYPTKKVGVVVTYTGQPASGAKITSLHASPTSAVIQASPEVLSRLSTIKTDPVSIEGATSTVSTKVSLKVPNHTLLVSPKHVTVTIAVRLPKTTSSAHSSSSTTTPSSSVTSG